MCNQFEIETCHKKLSDRTEREVLAVAIASRKKTAAYMSFAENLAAKECRCDDPADISRSRTDLEISPMKMSGAGIGPVRPGAAPGATAAASCSATHL